MSHDDLSDSFDSPVVAEAALPDPVQRSIRYDFMDHSVASEPLERIGLLNLPAASSPGEFVANLNRMLATIPAGAGTAVLDRRNRKLWLARGHCLCAEAAERLDR